MSDHIITNYDMKNEQKSHLQKANDELQSALAEFNELLSPSGRAALDRTQLAWNEYIISMQEFAREASGHGTNAALEAVTYAVNETYRRLKEIREQIDTASTQ